MLDAIWAGAMFFVTRDDQVATPRVAETLYEAIGIRIVKPEELDSHLDKEIERGELPPRTK